jgi:hypothetical protein
VFPPAVLNLRLLNPKDVLAAPVLLVVLLSYPTAVLPVPLVLVAKAPYPIAVLPDTVVLLFKLLYPIAVLPVPVVFNFNAALPIATLFPPVLIGFNALTPNEVLLLFSNPLCILLRLNTISTLSVVPIKLVPAVVPALPFSSHAWAFMLSVMVLLVGKIMLAPVTPFTVVLKVPVVVL